MATAEQVLDWARSQLGNTGEQYWKRYRGDTFINNSLTAWCAYFVSTGLDVNGVECPWFPNGYAPDQYDCPDDWIDKYSLKPGDPIAFDWDDDYRGDHTGFVESVKDWGCVCIEGNTSGGKVDRKQRLWSQILGGLRPKYDIPSSKGLWVAGSGGRWWYKYPDGSYPKNEWKQIDGEWYLFDEDGWIKSGWQLSAGKWYFLHDEHDGHFGELEHSKVLEDNGKYYILDASGALNMAPKFNLKHDGTYGALKF